MADRKNDKEKTEWQKNSARPSNFHEKDDKLQKAGDGKLKIQNESEDLSNEEERAIQDTLDSLSDEEE